MLQDRWVLRQSLFFQNSCSYQHSLLYRMPILCQRIPNDFVMMVMVHELLPLSSYHTAQRSRLKQQEAFDTQDCRLLFSTGPSNTNIRSVLFWGQVLFLDFLPKGYFRSYILLMQDYLHAYERYRTQAFEAEAEDR